MRGENVVCGLSKKVADVWVKTQLTHLGGKYSIERLLALDEYVQTASFCRVVLVISAVPVLVSALVLCQESIPLQDPKSGWASNFGFWVRVGFIGAIIGYAVSSQIGVWFDVEPLSSKRMGIYCGLMAVGHVATGMLVAEILVFPVPFFVLSLSVLWSPMTLGLFRLVGGSSLFRELSSQKESLRLISKSSNLQGIMNVLYPAFQVLYSKVRGTAYELPVLALLPLIKYVMKFLYASALRNKPDMIPEQVIFTVDLFDALYLATFMQNFSSTVLGVVIAAGFTQTVMELHDLHQRTAGLLSRLITAGALNPGSNDNLIAAVRLLCADTNALARQNHENVQVWSCLNYGLSPDSKTLLDKVDNCIRSKSSTRSQHSVVRVASPVVSLTESPRRHYSTPLSKTLTRQVLPVTPLAVIRGTPSRSKSSNNTASVEKQLRSRKLTETSSALREALEVLFASEYRVLTEYLEVVVPVFYGSFILVMVHLPSVQYHSEMNGVTAENIHVMVARILVYALFELASLVVLTVITRRNCGIHSLYQLAFVLETQMSLVLSTLMLWMLMTLTYRVYHFGADFTFEFPWI